MGARSLIVAMALAAGLPGSVEAKPARAVVLQMTTKLRGDQYRQEHPDRYAPGTRGATTFQVRGGLGKVRRLMSETLHRGDTPSFEVLPTHPGVSMTLLSRPGAQALNGEAVPVYQVTGLGASAVLPVHGLFPASAHLGKQQLAGYSAQNGYRLTIEHQDGTRTVLPVLASTGQVTEAAMNLPLKPGRNLVRMDIIGNQPIFAAASSSAFQEGRTKVLLWDGK